MLKVVKEDLKGCPMIINKMIQKVLLDLQIRI